NQAICERAFYVEETAAPTLVCPDTIQLICVNDIPGPAQLFGAIKNQLLGNCTAGFSSITILSDSGHPQNNSTHRTYTFKAKNHCGKVSPACSVTFKATGTCNQLCTASQGSWGDPNGTVGGMSTTQALQTLLAQHGPVTVGGGNHIVSAPDPACVQELLFGSGNIGFLPTGNFSCPLPASLANGDGSLNNQLAANAMALQLNIWYNQAFNNRNLGGQDLHQLPPCLVEFALLKDMAQNSTVNDLLYMTNQYLQGFVGNQTTDFPAMLNAALDNLNHFRVDCGLNAPCERPAHGRSQEIAVADIWGLQLVPNPATDVVTLTFESANATDMQIQVFDGRAVMLERNFQRASGLNSLEISLAKLPAGVYYISLKSLEGLKTLRLVKLRN
ncbi:MAG: T9SS type A sorting domain-containing protein, partial [Phycisphaerae bacterium]|nr:T9SS type A sorting domain-containing protein [Saprospiraceae bacterium]